MGMAVMVVAFATIAVVVLFDLDPRLEDSRERILRDFAGTHRATDLRFPGAAHHPIRPRQGLAADFDLSSSELSFVEQEIEAELQAKPGNSRLMYLRALVHLVYLQPGPAIDLLERLRLFSPNDPELLGALGYAHYLRGRAERSTGDLLRSVDFLDQAIAVSPDDPVLLFNAGIVYQRLKNQKEAVSRFRRFLQVSPEDGWAAEARQRLRDLSR
jgi:tetratricopeptide (TPR) repeat protein